MHVPPPPVPAKLREMLKDYPEHIERLQAALNTVVEKPSKAAPPFEVAIWVLEGGLETFISEARDELDTANAGDDSEAMSLAEGKLRLMFRARSGNGGMKGMHDLWEYFEKNKAAF